MHSGSHGIPILALSVFLFVSPAMYGEVASTAAQEKLRAGGRLTVESLFISVKGQKERILKRLDKRISEIPARFEKIVEATKRSLQNPTGKAKEGSRAPSERKALVSRNYERSKKALQAGWRKFLANVQIRRKRFERLISSLDPAARATALMEWERAQTEIQTKTRHLVEKTDTTLDETYGRLSAELR